MTREEKKLLKFVKAHWPEGCWLGDTAREYLYDSSVMDEHNLWALEMAHEGWIRCLNFGNSGDFDD